MEMSTRSAAREASAAVALIAVAIILAGCGGPAAPPGPTASEASPTATETSPAASPTASATPSTAPAPNDADGRVFETQNGTMRLQLPEGWSVEDASRLGTDLSGEPMWENMLDVTSPDGTQLVYYDGFGADAGSMRTDFGIVDERAMDVVDGVAAMSWWVQDSGRYFVHAAVATRSDAGMEPVPQVALPGVERNHTFGMLLLDDDQPWVATQAEAEELLGREAVVEALEVMAELELTGVEGSAMPPGVEP